jgi:hypothetical protein
VLLGQVALVLALEIAAPFDGVIKRLSARREDFDRLGVADPQEVVAGDRFERRDGPLSIRSAKKAMSSLQSSRTVRQRWRINSSASRMLSLRS